jgi:hypothetical protein
MTKMKKMMATITLAAVATMSTPQAFAGIMLGDRTGGTCHDGIMLGDRSNTCKSGIMLGDFARIVVSDVGGIMLGD